MTWTLAVLTTSRTLPDRSSPMPLGGVASDSKTSTQSAKLQDWFNTGSVVRGLGIDQERLVLGFRVDRADKAEYTAN